MDRIRIPGAICFEIQIRSYSNPPQVEVEGVLTAGLCLDTNFFHQELLLEPSLLKVICKILSFKKNSNI